MDFVIYWVLLPFMIWLVLTVVVIKVKDLLRERRLKRRKEELMEWLTYVGEGMDICWKPQNRHSKDEVKKWIAEMTTVYYKEIKRREDG